MNSALISVACDLAFIAESVQEQALTVLIEIKGMLTGLMNRLIAANGRRLRHPFVGGDSPTPKTQSLTAEG